MIAGLIMILILVLFLPFTKLVERNLEVFLFIMGILSILVSQVLDWPLVKEALISPINITLAVLIAGLLFRWFQKPIESGVLWISTAMPYRLFIALFTIVLGLISSIIDRKSTRLNSSHVAISYAVFCLKKKKNKKTETC